MASFTITRKDGSVHTVLVDDEDYDRVMASCTDFCSMLVISRSTT